MSSSRAEGMVFISPENMIVNEAIGIRLFEDPPVRDSCDLTVGDFDDCKLRVIVTPEQTNFISVHIAISNLGSKFKEEYYAPEAIAETYPGLEVTPEEGYDFAIGFDLDNPPNGDKAGTLAKFSSLRRVIMGAPITKALKALNDGSGASLPLITIPWRPMECMWIKPGADRCTFVYAVSFSEDMDRAMGRVMMQQMAKEYKSVNGAPPCTFSEAKSPPMEIRDCPGLEQYRDSCGFLSIVIFKSHIKDDKRFDKTVTVLSSLRNYLMYHIKASKTYLHMRMRRKVAGWLQVLNRAVHEQTKKEVKTSSGKTFKRAS